MEKHTTPQHIAIYYELNEHIINGIRSPIISCKIKYANKIINCVHNPEHVDMDCDINFVGHIHQLWRFKRIIRGGKITDAVNVGVDVWNLEPVSLKTLRVFCKPES